MLNIIFDPNKQQLIISNDADGFNDLTIRGFVCGTKDGGDTVHVAVMQDEDQKDLLKKLAEEL